VNIVNVMLESRVTERTKELETANARLSELTAALDKAQTVIQDLDGRILFWNGGMAALYGWSREQALGCKSHELLNSELPIPFSDIMDEVIERGSWSGEFRQRSRDGAPLWVASHWVLHRDATGVPVSVVKVNNDITAFKRTEEALRQSERLEQALAEKTVLIKEVHHRVKNNLAVIAGLLGMQASRIDDDRARIALAESQKRVLSMALIHERLYGTDRLDRVNFGLYVRQLTNELCAAYAVETGIVRVQIEAMEIDLSVHLAIPCGLILNELVSNALKYGFPDGRSGTVTVRFARLESGELSLRCCDDGVGIAEGFDWEGSKSLGLRIVKILTKQIDGDLILDRSAGGSAFEVRFPERGPSAMEASSI
jgi:PAS domain S-box-containing protein